MFLNKWWVVVLWCLICEFVVGLLVGEDNVEGVLVLVIGGELEDGICIVGVSEWGFVEGEFVGVMIGLIICGVIGELIGVGMVWIVW